MSPGNCSRAESSGAKHVLQWSDLYGGVKPPAKEAAKEPIMTSIL